MKGLIGLCRETFYPEFVEPLQLNRLLATVSKLDATTLGLEDRCQNMNRSSGWDFEDLLSEDKLHIKLLLIPQGSSIPLHDHPKMSGIIKIIWGKLHLRAFDWVETFPYSGLSRKHGDLVADSASAPEIILPCHKNLHTLYALEDVAFLDIFSPDYYNEDRPCTYYEIQEKLQIEGEELFHLTVKK
jgi:hypothetical protein